MQPSVFLRALEFADQRMSLFFGQCRAEGSIDLSLQRSAMVIVLVNRASQFNEARSKVAGALARAEIFFDLPKGFINLFQLGGETCQHVRAGEQAVAVLLEQAHLRPNVMNLHWVRESL